MLTGHPRIIHRGCGAIERGFREDANAESCLLRHGFECLYRDPILLLGVEHALNGDGRTLRVNAAEAEQRGVQRRAEFLERGSLEVNGLVGCDPFLLLLVGRGKAQIEVGKAHIEVELAPSHHYGAPEFSQGMAADATEIKALEGLRAEECTSEVSACRFNQHLVEAVDGDLNV